MGEGLLKEWVLCAGRPLLAQAALTSILQHLALGSRLQS